MKQTELRLGNAQITWANLLSAQSYAYTWCSIGQTKTKTRSNALRWHEWNKFQSQIVYYYIKLLNSIFMNLEINNSKQCLLKLLIKILSAKKHVIFVQNFINPILKAEPNLSKVKLQ